MDAVSANVTVEQNNLTGQVSALRRSWVTAVSERAAFRPCPAGVIASSAL
jgi:hypothetical protein